MKQFEIHNGQIRLEIREKRPDAQHDFQTHCVGYERLTYKALVDLIGLEQMAAKASRNKSGKATDGALQVRIIHRKQERLA